MKYLVAFFAVIFFTITLSTALPMVDESVEGSQDKYLQDVTSWFNLIINQTTNTCIRDIITNSSTDQNIKNCTDARASDWDINTDKDLSKHKECCFKWKAVQCYMDRIKTKCGDTAYAGFQTQVVPIGNKMNNCQDVLYLTDNAVCLVKSWPWWAVLLIIVGGILIVGAIALSLACCLCQALLKKLCCCC